MTDGPDSSLESARRQIADGMLSIVMPAHNLGHAIADNIRRVDAFFAGEIPFEIVVVNDGSSDDTKDCIQSVSENMPHVRMVHLETNLGKGAAVLQGFSSASGSHIALLDADLDLPPEQLSAFFAIMERDEADVVIGSKRHPDSKLDYPWHRRVISALYFAMVKIGIGLPIRDTQTGIKLFKRKALEWASPRMLVKRFAFDLELLTIIHQGGFKIAESPVTLEFHEKLGCVSAANIRQISMDTMAIFYRTRMLDYYKAIPDTAMPDPTPMVSVVVALPEASKNLDDCMAGLALQDYEHFEVILLPDEPMGKTWQENVREIPTGQMRPAAKRNMGIEHSKGSIVAFIDDDAAPLADWLTRTVVHFSNDDVGGVGGPSFTPPDDPYLAKLGGEVYANWFVSGPYRYRYAVAAAREVEDFPSCNLSIRTDLLKKLGGFRTDYWPGEDTYLCMEIVKNLGKKIIYDPRIRVLHHRRKLYIPHLQQLGRYAVHRGYFAKKFPSTSRKLSYMMPSLFVLGLIGGGIASVFVPALRIPYFAALLIYTVPTLASCLRFSPISTVLIWLGLLLTHIVYGIGFLMGLMAKGLKEEQA